MAYTMFIIQMAVLIGKIWVTLAVSADLSNFSFFKSVNIVFIKAVVV